MIQNLLILASKYFICYQLLILCSPIFAQNNTHEITDTPLDSLVSSKLNDIGTINDIVLEIDGLIIDETRTKSGHEFYDLLISAWEESPIEINNYLIKVVEKPFRLNTSMIEIYINDELVVNTMLQPKSDVLEETSASINQTLKEYLLNYNKIANQLEAGDQEGTGIY